MNKRVITAVKILKVLGLPYPDLSRRCRIDPVERRTGKRFPFCIGYRYPRGDAIMDKNGVIRQIDAGIHRVASLVNRKGSTAILRIVAETGRVSRSVRFSLALELLAMDDVKLILKPIEITLIAEEVTPPNQAERLSSIHDCFTPPLGKLPEPTFYIRNWDDLHSAATFAATKFGGLQPWYRGHANSDWRLVPALFRKYLAGREYNIIGQFRTRSRSLRNDLPSDDQLEAWISLMQHFGLPTRLLDWTESPLVAAFFAVNDGDASVPGAIWALDPILLNFQSGGERCIFDMNQSQPKALFTAAIQTPTKEDDRVFAVRPTHVDLRMTLQQSQFTIHTPHVILEEKYPNAVIKFIVPADAKPTLAESLGRMKITLASLFPDLQHLAQWIASLKFAGLEYDMGKPPIT